MKKGGSCVTEVECGTSSCVRVTEERERTKSKLFHITLGKYNKKQEMN